MVYFMENPMNKWMIWGAHPYFWKHLYGIVWYYLVVFEEFFFTVVKLIFWVCTRSIQYTAYSLKDPHTFNDVKLIVPLMLELLHEFIGTSYARTRAFIPVSTYAGSNPQQKFTSQTCSSCFRSVVSCSSPTVDG